MHSLAFRCDRKKRESKVKEMSLLLLNFICSSCQEPQRKQTQNILTAFFGILKGKLELRPVSLSQNDKALLLQQ